MAFPLRLTQVLTASLVALPLIAPAARAAEAAGVDHPAELAAFAHEELSPVAVASASDEVIVVAQAIAPATPEAAAVVPTTGPAIDTPAASAPAAAPALEPTPAEPHLVSLPTSGMLTGERLKLPNGERMGVVSGALLFDIGSDWGLGPAVYGAVTGRRGGLFVGGVEIQKRWGLGYGFAVSAGLFAGGGGGAAAPVGSGLMLRPAVTLLKDFGDTFQLGLSYSQVRFPDGDIRSNQFGLVLGWRQEFLHFDGAGPIQNASSLPSTGMGFDRIGATVTSYKLTDGSGRNLGLIGARAERRSGLRDFTWGIEAAAAAKGDAAGYMEILATASLSVAPFEWALPSWRIGLRASGGAGGGGSVPTGGGLLAKLAATTEIRLAPGWTLGADFGEARSRNGGFRAHEAQAWLSMDLEPGLDSHTADRAHVVRTEWVGTIQHHTRIARSDGSQRPLDTIGLKLNRYLDDHFYVSGQAHSAFAGGAGAYSVGLVGLGVSAAPLSRVRVGVEALGGAAGGGGVATAGGAITQGMSWAAWQPGDVGEIRLGLGVTRNVHGGHNGPVAEVSWGRAFGMAAR